MNNEEWKQYMTDKFVEIEGRLARIEERLTNIETDWKTIKKVAWLILSVILAKLGIDVSGIMGGG